MPLYEDMAPWNIFFEAGKLIYIDYDTRNLHFDEAVPMAYQVIPTPQLQLYRLNRAALSRSVDRLHLCGCVDLTQVIEVLMNYKRTVQDFQRCDSHATTQ